MWANNIVTQLGPHLDYFPVDWRLEGEERTRDSLIASQTHIPQSWHTHARTHDMQDWHRW